jgi:hypothetical protein
MKEEAQQYAARAADLLQTLAGRWFAHMKEVSHELPREKQICP